MRTLHRALMTITLAAVLAVAVGALQPWAATALAQHGHGATSQHGQAGEADDHFSVVAERLELTAEQREKLAAPFAEAFAAMQEMHRLHGVIAEQLTEAQRGKLAAMMGEMMGGMHADHGQQHHDGSQH